MPKAIAEDTKEKYEKIIKAYEHGKTVDQIMVIMGICRRTVYSALEWQYTDKNHKYYNRSKTAITTEGELNAIQRDYAKGLSVHDIAQKYNVSAPTIRARLKELGISIRPAGRQKVVDDIQLKRLYAQGKTKSELADYFHVTETTIYAHLNAMGIKSNIDGRRSKIDDTKLKQYWKEGLNPEEIAKKFHVVPETIKLHAKKLNLC